MEAASREAIALVTRRCECWGGGFGGGIGVGLALGLGLRAVWGRLGRLPINESALRRRTPPEERFCPSTS
ncbi:hypothetical protein DHEL01_v207482 [Diaporthe helianthi]|uniref:Uncharacterized protein n=1 Tax=Diaporthe helianthi TaxID=158607 RepID=A0A2P5HV36_DIAHE|nr:hypothetical protein DHEL01_v207482 [Diaporthe helianthi]